MELSANDIERIIRTNPGDLAICRLENGALQTLYFSPALPEYSGVDAETYRVLVSENAVSIVFKNDYSRVQARLDAIAEGDERDLDGNCRIFHSEHGFVWLHVKARVIGLQNDCPVLLLAFYNASSESVEHAMLLDHVSEKIYVIDSESYELLYANDYALKTWAHGNFCGRTCYRHIAGRGSPCPWCPLPEMQDGFVHLEESYSPAAERWYRIDGREINWLDRRAYAFYSVDITEQKLQQQSLKIDKMDLEKIIGNVPVGVGVFQFKNGVFTQIAMNPYIQSLLGPTPEYFTIDECEPLALIHPNDLARVVEEIHELETPGIHRGLVFRFRRSD